MAVGGEVRGSSPYARKAAQARALLEGGRGGVVGASNRGMARWCGSSTPAELRARRGRSSGARLWRGRRGSAGASERAHGHQQVKAGAWARCQAAAAARRLTPTCGRHAADAFCRGHGVARRAAGDSAARGGRPGWRGAGLGRARRGARRAGARWAGFGWQARSEAAAQKIENGIFQLIFKKILNYHLSNIILSKKMTSFENVPKMKVA